MTTGTDGVSRRDIFRTAAAGGIALALAPGTAMAQAGAGSAAAAPISAATVTGIVFDDTAGDGSRKPDSRGIPGVLVSNGREIAVTDIGGHYSLPVGDETVVFVIKPSGYMTPLEPGTMLPRFHYIHQPNGSPASLDLTFAGIAPTGPLPASVDFPLRRQDEPKSFEVVLFTDPQPETDVEVDFIREDVLAPLRGTRARFGMTLGDLMFDDLSLYGRYNALVGTIGLPWYNIGGNHDLNFEAPDRRHSPSSACSDPAIMRFTMPTPSSSCWTMSTTSAPTGRNRTGPANTRGGSTRRSSISCATFSLMCPTTR